MVQWFPGHMAKSVRRIKELLNRVDLVIEILDARAPHASVNPLLAELIQGKPRLVLLNKDDLADPLVTHLWLRDYAAIGGTLPLRVSAVARRGLDAVPRGCRSLCRPSQKSSRKPLRALIAGIPNVGKSTLINALAGRRRTNTGASAGLTRDFQRIPVSGGLELYDSPGLLWHKFDDPIRGLRLAALGAVKESNLPEEAVIGELTDCLRRHYKERLTARYGLEDLPEDSRLIAELIARRRGCLLPGGGVDWNRVCALMLKDLREGLLGRVSLERPETRFRDGPRQPNSPFHPVPP